MIANPGVLAVDDPAGSATLDGNVGSCVTDTFAVNSPGAIGSPIICGINTGYHS